MIESFLTEVKEDDNGELYIEFPESLLEKLGWTENTALWWKVDTNKNTVILSEKHPDDE